MKKLFTLLFSLSCTAAMAQNIQGDFDSWRTYTSGFPSTNLEAPNGWYGTDSLLFAYGPFIDPGATFTPQLTKSTPSHSGAFAAKATSKDQGSTFGVIPGLLVNARPDIDPTNFDPNDPLGGLIFDGGLPTIERVNTVSAWIKYSPQGTDAGQMALFAYLEGAGANGTDSLVGYADTLLDQAYTSFTQFKLRVEYVDATVVPNKVLVGFISSEDQATDGSVIHVDDAEVMSASGIKIPVFQQEVVKVYPSPATNVLNLTTSYGTELTWQAFSTEGKVVANTTLNGNASINIAQLPVGTYVYRVSDASGKVLQQSKFSKQ